MVKLQCGTNVSLHKLRLWQTKDRISLSGQANTHLARALLTYESDKGPGYVAAIRSERALHASIQVATMLQHLLYDRDASHLIK